MKTSNSSFKKALVLGVISGMRTSATLHFTRSLVSDSNTKSGIVRFFQKKQVLPGVGLLGVTELIVDKLPQTPDRIAKGGPAIKAGTAALCGAAVYQAEGKNAVAGAVIASLAAVASTYSFFYLRKALCKKTGIADPFIGMAEDALAIAAGMALIKGKS